MGSNYRVSYTQRVSRLTAKIFRGVLDDILQDHKRNLRGRRCVGKKGSNGRGKKGSGLGLKCVLMLYACLVLSL